MLSSFHKTSLVFWRKAALFLLCVIGTQTICIVVSLSFLFNKENSVILVPQKNPNTSYALSNKSFGKEYLVAWADGICNSFLTANAYVLKERSKDILSITSPEYFESLKKQLNKEVEIMSKDAISTTFYPQNFKIIYEKSEIEVSGAYHTHFSSDRKPIVTNKTWIIGWKRVNGELILLTKFQEKEDKK